MYEVLPDINFLVDLDASIAADPSQLDYLLRQEQEKDSPVMNQADGSLSHDMTYSHSSTTFSMSTDGVSNFFAVTSYSPSQSFML